MNEELSNLVLSLDLATVADAGDFPAITATINAATVEQIDETLRSTIWLSQTFPSPVADPVGWTEADILIDSLDNAGNPPRVRQALRTMTNRERGISFAAPEVQAMIDFLAARDSWPGDLAARVKAYGRRMVSPAAAAGVDPAPTAADVATAWGEYRLAQRITNAAALMSETLTAGQSPAEQAATVAAAWENAV